MTGKLIFEERVTIPLDIDGLQAFRRWALSDDFPEEGRIDFVEGQIEVDMTPEDLFTHGTVKTELVVTLGQRAKTTVPGDLFTDRTRISSSTRRPVGRAGHRLRLRGVPPGGTRPPGRQSGRATRPLDPKQARSRLLRV